MRILGICLVLVVLALAGCAAVAPRDYAGQQPVLDLSRYFDGKLDGWGMVQDRDGRVLRRFHVVIDARWQGQTGTLDEQFTWSDGQAERRVWTLTRGPDGHYTGRAADVVGEARGVAAGNTLQWKYVLRLPPAQGGYDVDIDDWMYLIDADTLLNRSEIRKFGVRFADITIAFRRRD